MKPLYLIRFENGKRVASILVDAGVQDRINKEAQAKEWCEAKDGRQYVVAPDDSKDIKLVGNEIVIMTPEEIEAEKPIPVKSALELRVEALEAEVQKLKDN